MYQIGFDVAAQLAPILAGFVALLALPCAIVVTLALIRLFRSRVARSMAAVAVSVQQETRQRSPGSLQRELQIEGIDATRARARAARAAPLVIDMRRRAWRLAAIYAAATAMYPLLLAAAMIAAIGFSPTQHVLLAFALLYVTFGLPLATPVALAPTMVLRRQPPFLIAAVVGLIALMWVWDSKVGVDSIGLWLMVAALPAAAILLLNTRRLRAIGPIVFAAMLIVIFGFAAGLVYADLYLLDVIGPLHFVRADLAGLSLVEGFERYWDWLLGLPLAQAAAEISALVDDPTDVFRVDNADRLTAWVWLSGFSIWLAGTAVGVVAAWGLTRWLARNYRTRRASDQMLSIDVLMLILAAPMFLVYVGFFDPLAIGGVLAGLAGYKLVSRLGLRRRHATAPPVPHTLLLLRVFGFDGRTQRLLEALGRRWRYLGPIRLIGGTDLADTTIEPHEFFEFLSGRLSRAFIRDRSDLESRLAESSITPDPDGRFRIEDFFCHDDTWRMTVVRLARDAAAVLMDLRGFSPANRGCIFEIEELVAAVPLQRIVLLVDASTDLAFLEQTLHGAWRAVPEDSPNAAPGAHRLRILEASRRQGPTLATLLGLLCESATAHAAPRAMADAAS